MNEPTIRLETRPEITAFVERVRARLDDLSDEHREELVGGLEADIAELVADGGSVAELGDPRAYADELRAAAGLERRPLATGEASGGLTRRQRARRRLGARLDGALDASRRRWAELVDVPALGPAWDLVVTLRPVWWVLRAWVAIQLLDVLTQGGDLATPVPTVGGPLLGALLWLVAIVVSVQIGRNRIWPGSGPARRTLARVVLLALNAFAVVATPLVLGQFPANGAWEQEYYGGTYESEPGLMNQDQYVRNVYPYDAQGNPLTGVQLFDEAGNPLGIATWLYDDDVDGDGRVEVAYPWLNGERQLFNVFPLPEREQPAWRTDVSPDAWDSANPPTLQDPPLAVVPPAVLPSAEDDGPVPDDVADEDAGAEVGQQAERDRDPDGGPTAERQRDSEKAQGR